MIDGLQFPNIPRLELDQLLVQLRDKADDVLATQGRLRGLLRANAAVAADLSLPALLRHIVDSARDLLHARYAAIVVLGRDGELQQLVHAGIDDALAQRICQLPEGQGIVDLLTASPDHMSDSPIRLRRPSSCHQGVGSFLIVPIRLGQELFGNLYLRAAPRAFFSTDDEELVTALAATAGVAIANARLLAESEQRRRWLAASSQLTNQLLAAETDQPLMCVTRSAMTAADADFATLTVRSSNDKGIVAATAGDTAAPLMDRVAPLDGSPDGQAILTGTPVLLTGHRTDSAVDGAGSFGLVPTMIVPLSAGAHIRGAITIGRKPDRSGFTTADLDMAVSFGTQAAVALALAESRDAQIIDAQLDDRDRIAFDMHDHVMGELFALGMGLQGLAGAIRNPMQKTRVASYVETLDRVIRTIRTTIFQLQPRRHDPAGLQTRIMGIAESHTAQLGYPPQLHFAGPLHRVVDEPLTDDILAVTTEALSNCARHAEATAITVAVAVDHDLLTVEITDNGHGIGTSTRSSGLTNLRRRAENHGGSFTVTEADGVGTRLTWSAICTLLQPANHHS